MKQIDIKSSHNNSGTISCPGNKDMFRIYMNELTKINTLTREEEHLLFLNVKNNKCKKSIDLLCKHNLKFVVSIAKTYNNTIHNTVLTLEDLICEGNIGLCNAIHKFDCSSDNKFISYAVWHIRQMILKYISDNNKSVRVPINVRNDIARIKAEYNRLSHKLGREPEITELYEYCLIHANFKYGIPSYERFCIMYTNDKFDRLLSEKTNEDSTMSLSDNIVCLESNNTMESIYINDNKQVLNNLLNTLSNRESGILKHFYGINCENESMHKIGTRYDITQERVRQIINKSIKTLKYKHNNINPLI